MSLLNDILEHMELAPDQLTTYIDEYETIQPYDCMIYTARRWWRFRPRIIVPQRDGYSVPSEKIPRIIRTTYTVRS